MTDVIADRPNARRLELLRSVPSPLDEVAEAMSLASETERRFYVERVEGGYRWSFTHPGGGYPLLRIAARFLLVDYTHISIGFRTLDDGMCVLCADPDQETQRERSAVVEFDKMTPRPEVKRVVLRALAPQGLSQV